MSEKYVFNQRDFDKLIWTAEWRGFKKLANIILSDHSAIGDADGLYCWRCGKDYPCPTVELVSDSEYSLQEEQT